MDRDHQIITLLATGSSASGKERTTKTRARNTTPSSVLSVPAHWWLRRNIITTTTTTATVHFVNQTIPPSLLQPMGMVDQTPSMANQLYRPWLITPTPTRAPVLASHHLQTMNPKPQASLGDTLMKCQLGTWVVLIGPLFSTTVRRTLTSTTEAICTVTQSPIHTRGTSDPADYSLCTYDPSLFTPL